MRTYPPLLNALGLVLLLAGGSPAQVVPGVQINPGGQVMPVQPGGQVMPVQPGGQQGMARTVGMIAYRNDTGIPIVVQASSIAANGKPQLGPPHPINPRGAAWDQVAGIGPKIITVYDAQQKVLHQGPVTFNGQNLFFSIQLEVIQKGKEKVPVAKLVPVPVPGMMMPNQGVLPPPNRR